MPQYEVHLPSLHDGLGLDCIITSPRDVRDFAHTEWDVQRGYRGAVVAHPWSLMRGDFTDPVVQATVKTLVKADYIVMSFNFRGAGTSKGTATFSGKAEVDDYASVFGFLVYYLQQLSVPEDSLALSPVKSSRDPLFHEDEPFAVPPRLRKYEDHILLAGYSWGSLVMARLPPVEEMIERFANAEKGSIANTIISAAQDRAKHDQKVLDNKTPPRGYSMHSGAFQSPERQRALRQRETRVNAGWEGVKSSDRPRSKDSRWSEELVRNIVQHVPSVRRKSESNTEGGTRRPTTASSKNKSGPRIRAAYLVISPVLIPFTTMLVPPAPFFWMHNYRNAASGLLSLTCPVCVVYGDSDSMTSVKRLDSWAKKLKRSNPDVQTAKIHQAGHFWGGAALEALQERIRSWVKDELHVAR